MKRVTLEIKTNKQTMVEIENRNLITSLSCIHTKSTLFWSFSKIYHQQTNKFTNHLLTIFFPSRIYIKLIYISISYTHTHMSSSCSRLSLKLLLVSVLWIVKKIYKIWYVWNKVIKTFFLKRAVLFITVLSTMELESFIFLTFEPFVFSILISLHFFSHTHKHRHKQTNTN